MIKKLLALVCLCSACGAPPEELDGSADAQEEVTLGTAEQDILLQTTYGIQRGPGAGLQFRCVSGAASDCMVPAKKTIEVDVDFDAVTASGDRSAISAALSAALQTAQNGDDGFTWQSFSRTGFPPSGENACRLLVQRFFTPVITEPNDMRHYVSNNSYTTLVDFGTHSTFRTMVANAEWTSFKAHRGASSCSSSPSNPCFIAAKKMILAYMANCAGVGFTTNSSANGRGNDLEADSGISTLAADGDLCRMKQYETTSDGGRLIPDFSDCAL